MEEIIAVMDEPFNDLIIFYTQFRFTLVIQERFQSLNDFEELRSNVYDSVKNAWLIKVKDGLERYERLAKKREKESIDCNIYQ